MPTDLIVKAAIFRKRDGHWCTTEVIKIPDMDEDTPFSAVFLRAYELLEFKRHYDLSDFIVIIRTLDGKHERVVPDEMEVPNCHYTNKEEEKMAFAKTGDADLASVRCSCGGEIDQTSRKCKQCGKTYEAKDLENKKEASDESKNRTDG